MKRTPLCLACCLMTAAILLMVAARSHAVPPPIGIASTWLANPTSGNWNSNTNWSPPIAPNGPSDEAIFATSSITSVSLSANTQVDGIIFNSGASAFTIIAAPAFGSRNTITLTISGVGITNNSGITQNFATHEVIFVPGEIVFENSATAGSSIVITNGGFVQFHDSSTAGGATINNPGAGFGGISSVLDFYDRSSGGNATINNAGSTSFTLAAVTNFHNSSTAGSATINNGASSFIGNTVTNFYDTSTAGSATINNQGTGSSGLNGGVTEFHDTSTAGTATINNAGGNFPAGGGFTNFRDSSTAGSATITNAASPAGALTGAGVASFLDTSSAGNGTFVNTGASGANGHGGETRFVSSSTAANGTFNNDGATVSGTDNGGTTFFFDSSTAGSALIANKAGVVSRAGGGSTQFFSSSSAGSATIINSGALNAGGGNTQFKNSSSAGSAEIVNNGGIGLVSARGQTIFRDTSDAGSSTLVANGLAGSLIIGPGFGGEILFNDSSTGGTSRVEVFGNGLVDISSHNAPGVTIGSVEGSGNVFLGSNKLTVGSNNLSTSFSGVIHDGAFGGGGGAAGSLTKTGSGTLTLSGTSTYTGATTVSAGKLIVDGNITSSSGLTVNVGAILGGHGSVSTIAGAGIVEPGDSPGILTATQLNPSAGTSFLFEFTQVGSPTYSNAAASGNDLLDLTGLTPFTTALTSPNQITVDFSGASLAAGEMFRGGFFTDIATATSEVCNATFLYTGLNGFTVHFDGFVTEPIAAFASAAVINGTVLQFDIEGNGGGGSSVPDFSPTWLLLSVSLFVLVGLELISRVRSGNPRPWGFEPQTF